IAWRTESSRRARPPVGGRAVVGTSAAYKRADGYPRPVTTPRRAPGGFPVVGIIGGGQLARMCAGPAAELGITLSVLAESDEASAALVVPSSPVADHTERDAVHAFARHCDVVTFDHEHVPPHVLELLVAEGVQLHPRPEALTYAQDKLAMRERLTELGIPCPRWARVSTSADVTAFGGQVGWPVVAKTPRGGYDGKGVRVVGGSSELADWLERASTDGTGLLVEEWVPFRRELAVLVARSPSGQAAAWPVVETVQTDGVCTEVLAPAPDLDVGLSSSAVHAALRVAGALDVTGVLAVELFEVGEDGGDPSFVVNELAMRPHNSGHWTMDGAVTGQFEQHLRAVLDLPLGSPRPHGRWTVKANMYGKGVRPGRKLGHVNVLGDDLGDLRARAGHAADYIRGVVTE